MGLTAPDDGRRGGARRPPPGAGSPPSARRRDQKALQIVFQNPDSALNRRHSVQRLISRSLSKLGRLHRPRLRERLLAAGQVGAAARALPADAPLAALGRPQAARRDRPRVRRRPADRRLRRADLGARRLGPGGDPQPAHRPAAARGRRLPVHQPRPRRRALPGRPDRRALPRPRDGDRPRRAGVRRPAASLHRGAAVARCRRSTTSTACGSGWRARSPAPPTRRTGCPFHTRCPRKIGEICETTEPELREEEAGHGIRCHIPLEELRRLQAVDGSAETAPAAQADA